MVRQGDKLGVVDDVQKKKEKKEKKERGRRVRGREVKLARKAGKK